MYRPQYLMVEKTPKCFTKEQYERWLEKLFVKTQPTIEKKNHSSYCTDCTPTYKMRMLKEHKCIYPGTEFTFDEHGFIEGVRQEGDRINK